MKFKLTYVTTEKRSGAPATARTHRLSFQEVGDAAAQPAAGPAMGGPSTVNLLLTEAEAAAYELDGEYTLDMAPAAA